VSVLSPACCEPRSAELADQLPTLLLCPPGRCTYQRDNYCSHRAKGRYYWYPYDLVVQSGFMAAIGPLEVLDATALGLDPEATLRRIAESRYRAVLALIGGLSWSEDTSFLERLPTVTGAPLHVTGDVPRFHAQRTLATLPFVDGVLLDYRSPALADHLATGGSGGAPGLCRRGERAQTAHPPMPGFSIPIPRWDLFPPRLYSLPFARRSPFASVAASFGCPHSCRFCTAVHLPYARRDRDNLFQELHFLRRQGYREIHFKDLSFGVDRDHYLEILERMLKEGLDLSFNCLARADDLDLELLRLMRRAGCHLVHIGVETASEQSLKRVGKRESQEQITAAIVRCRQAGIRVLASYVLGFPWEDPADIERTIELAVRLDTDFASFNRFVQRDVWPDDAGATQASPDSGLDRIEHRAYRRFYFRPTYLVRQLARVHSLDQLRLGLVNGARLFRDHFAA